MNIEEIYKELQQFGGMIIQEQGKWVVKTPPGKPLKSDPQLENKVKSNWKQLKELVARTAVSDSEATIVTPSAKPTTKQLLKSVLPITEHSLPEPPHGTIQLSLLLPETEAERTEKEKGNVAWETDSQDKTSRKQAKKKGKPKPLVEGEKTFAKDEFVIMLWLRDSHRLPGELHWFLNDFVLSFKSSSELRVRHPPSVEKINYILERWAEDKYLQYIETKYRSFNEMGEIGYAEWIKEECFITMREHFKDLELHCGTAFFLPVPFSALSLKQADECEQGIYIRKHCWLVAPDGGIVDPAWKLFPNAIMCYEGKALP
jgi:hypothetical protein